MKVLHIGKFYPPHRGGIETHLEVLCGQLKNKVELEVLVASNDRETKEEIIDGVRVSRLATVVKAKGTSFCPALAGRIRKSKPDLLHIHLPNPAAVLACFASRYSGPVVAGYHSDVVRQKMLAGMLNPLTSRFLSRCSSIILSSPNYLTTSLSIHPHRDRCRVVPYGISLEPFEHADLPAVERIRKEHGDRLILAVGRLVYYKGFEHAIKAMTSIQGKLLLAGDGPLREDLEETARAAGVASKVVFLGGVSDRELVNYYAATDVFILPSILRSESFGIVQVEAMASGKPVVNTSIDSGVPFVSIGGETGLTVPPADSAALAQAINILLDNDDLRARFGSAARHRAHRLFSAPTMAARILEIYDSAMAGRAAKSA